VLLGRRWSYRETRAEARARAGRQGGAGGRREWLGRRCRETAAAVAFPQRRRRLGIRERAGEKTENEQTRARTIG
jgi:hypothetical protein